MDLSNLPYTIYLCDTKHRPHCPSNLCVDCCGNCMDLNPHWDLNPASYRNQDGGHLATVTKFCAATPLQLGEEASPQTNCTKIKKNVC